MNTYYVRFRYQIGMSGRGDSGEGFQIITRDRGICGESDLHETAQAIHDKLRENLHIPDKAPINIVIVSWQRFEDAMIALVN